LCVCHTGIPDLDAAFVGYSDAVRRLHSIFFLALKHPGKIGGSVNSERVFHAKAFHICYFHFYLLTGTILPIADSVSFSYNSDSCKQNAKEFSMFDKINFQYYQGSYTSKTVKEDVTYQNRIKDQLPSG